MEVKVIEITLQDSEVTIKNTDYRKFRQYLNQGFRVCDRPYGYYVLKRKDKAITVIQYEGNATSVIDLGKELFRYYGGKRLGQLVKKFEYQLRTKQVALQLNPQNGQFSIIKK